MTLILAKFSFMLPTCKRVTFKHKNEAAEAISRFNGADFEGRSMTVNEAKPMAPRESRGGFGGGNRDRGGFGGDRGGFGGGDRGGRRGGRF